MEDAAGFFANVFGGERFRDYVSLPCSLFWLVCVLPVGGANPACCRALQRQGIGDRPPYYVPPAYSTHTVQLRVLYNPYRAAPY